MRGHESKTNHAVEVDVWLIREEEARLEPEPE
jgi:hypothetical protein